MTASVTLRTPVSDPGAVAASLRPDNTSEMATCVEDGVVVTRIERATASGLQSTVDDYLVNLQVATNLLEPDSNPDRDSNSEGSGESNSMTNDNETSWSE